MEGLKRRNHIGIDEAWRYRIVDFSCTCRITPLPRNTTLYPIDFGPQHLDVMIRAGDLFGDGVNIAARLQTLGCAAINSALHRHPSKEEPGAIVAFRWCSRTRMETPNELF